MKLYRYHSPGVMSGCALIVVTLRLILIARASVTTAASPFLPASEGLSDEPDLIPADACMPWPGFLTSEAGWMGTGPCFKLRAWRVWVCEEDVVAPCWLRMARFWTWFLTQKEAKVILLTYPSINYLDSFFIRVGWSLSLLFAWINEYSMEKNVNLGRHGENMLTPHKKTAGWIQTLDVWGWFANQSFTVPTYIVIEPVIFLGQKSWCVCERFCGTHFFFGQLKYRSFHISSTP